MLKTHQLAIILALIALWLGTAFFSKHASLVHGLCAGYNLHYYLDKRKEPVMHKMILLVVLTSVVGFTIMHFSGEHFQFPPKALSSLALLHAFLTLWYSQVHRNIKNELGFHRTVESIRLYVPMLFEGRECLRINNKLFSEKELMKTLDTRSDYSEYILYEVIGQIEQMHKIA